MGTMILIAILLVVGGVVGILVGRKNSKKVEDCVRKGKEIAEEIKK